MGLDFNFLSAILVLLGLFTLVLSIVAFKRLGTSVYSFGYITLSATIWAIFYGIELGSTTQWLINICNKTEYLGISFLPAFWIIFTLHYTGKDRLLTTRNIIAFFLIPSITLILEWTNDYHHMQYATNTYGYADGIYQLIITKGPWYWVHTVFFYSMLVWGAYLLIKKFSAADPIFKKQNRAILFAVFIPWIANILYLSGATPFSNIDITPFAFVITAIIIALALLRFRLFDIVPVAREKIMEAMQEGVLVLDKNDRIVDANNQMRQILAPYCTTLIGTEFSDLHIGDGNLSEVLNKHNNDKIELKLGEDSNSSNYYAVTVTPLIEGDGKYDGQFLLFRNITQRKQSEENLQALNQLKDRLFSIISHDLRSPLNTLLSIVTMTSEGQITEEELKSFLPEISKNLGYTTGLVNNLLQWSKSQLKGESMNPVNININKKVETVLQLMQKTASDKKITITNTVAPDLFVYADRDMIQAVFRNLIGNAIKFSNLGGRIDITAEPGTTHTTICIADNGIGIDKVGLDKLFGLETFTTRGTINEQGTGLGLLLCKDFIEKNNGKIWVESTVGEGSRFYFTLPNAHTA